MSAEASQPWTVLRLLQWTKDYLRRARLEAPRLAAEMLLAHALGCRRIELYARFDYRPGPDELATFRELVRRAGRYEPVAYLVGEKEFYSLRFKVTPDVLVPRPETEILVVEAAGHLRGLGRAGVTWDVCTGCGCVAAAVASQVRDVRVLATDISPLAVALAVENAAAHGLSDRVVCRTADLLALPEDCLHMNAFDVITANPPYIADNQKVTETVKHEPRIAIRGGPDGLDLVRALVRGCPSFLAAGGMLAMEFGFAQEDDVRDLIVATGAFTEPRILRDRQGIERAVVATKR